MRIALNPVEQAARRAERRINIMLAATTMDLAHDRKRQLAMRIDAGEPATAEFEQAARIEGMTTDELVRTILAKPDALMARENARRELILQVRSARTAGEIARLMDEHGVWENPSDGLAKLIE